MKLRQQQKTNRDTIDSCITLNGRVEAQRPMKLRRHMIHAGARALSTTFKCRVKHTMTVAGDWGLLPHTQSKMVRKTVNAQCKNIR